MKDKIKKVLDLIISKDDKTARAELQKIIREDKRYIAYKKSLQDYGFIFETMTIDEKVFTDIKEVLKDFPKEVKLKVLDETWKLIKIS